MKILCLIFALCAPCMGQAWSGILSSSRAIDWSKAGLPATLPDGETTLNPWTPPTRTQCGATVSCSNVSGDVATLFTALRACTAGHYVLVAAGTCDIDSNLFLSNGSGYAVPNNVTLRGSGAASTTFRITTGGQLQIGAASGGGTCAFTSGSNFSAGSTSITVNCPSGAPSSGYVAAVAECDTGTTGNPCSGTQTDNGGIFICGGGPNCQGGSDTPIHQYQYVLISSVTSLGSSNYTVVISPGLYMPNYSFGLTPILAWNDQSYQATGMGLEDATIYFTSNSVAGFSIGPAYASWVKGIRLIGDPVNTGISTGNGSKNLLIANNYVYAQLPSSLNTGYTNAIQEQVWSDSLFINNIITGGSTDPAGGKTEGVVFAYNYGRDANTSLCEVDEFQHAAETTFFLREGNEIGTSQDDNTHGTHNLNTWFRNYYNGCDPPYYMTSAGNGDPRMINIGTWSRFDNAVGNILSQFYGITTYNGTVGSAYVFGFDTGDSMNTPSSMRWGNCDTVNGACRFNSAEVPTSLNPNSFCTGSGTPYTGCTGSGTGTINVTALENSVPGNDNLPCSFFNLVNDSSTTCPGYSSGTGLSWWKVCDMWGTFPTSCSHSTIHPFPPTGPDVSGGPYTAGTGSSYDIPAAIAFKNLPIDTSFQSSYTVTGSSWSSSCSNPTSTFACETLTVTIPTGGASIGHVMGGFQLTGANSGCIPTSGVSYTARSDNEILMTGSTSTTVIYALPSVSSDPGCTGTLKFPDVRQFDERVYQADNATTAATPTCSANCAGTYTGSVVVTFANSNGGTTVMCGAVSPTTPVTNGSGTGCSTGTNIGTGATANVTISSSETYNVVAGTSLLADSSVLSEAYTINAATGPIMNGAFKLTGGKLN